MEADLERAKRGDRDAMARLVDAHYDAVYRFCARRVGAQLAEDLAQETFIVAQRQLRNFESRSSLSTWLFGIAHNQVRNAVRKRKLEPVDWTMDAGTTNPESTLIDREALRKALGGLSEEHREVVLLHEVEGLSYDEAAEVLGIPPGTVKSRLHHAFLNLRRALGVGSEVTA
jgi:RNA polymerase sigma-70 factor (ECF subfamily)